MKKKKRKSVMKLGQLIVERLGSPLHVFGFAVLSIHVEYDVTRGLRLGFDPGRTLRIVFNGVTSAIHACVGVVPYGVQHVICEPHDSVLIHIIAPQTQIDKIRAGGGARIVLVDLIVFCQESVEKIFNPDLLMDAADILSKASVSIWEPEREPERTEMVTAGSKPQEDSIKFEKEKLVLNSPFFHQLDKTSLERQFYVAALLSGATSQATKELIIFQSERDMKESQRK
jgi:hypothetical protein